MNENHTSICFWTFLGLFLGLRLGREPVMTKMSSSISSFESAIQNFLFSFFSVQLVSAKPLSRSDFGVGLSPLLLTASTNSPPLWLFLEPPAPISKAPLGIIGFLGLKFHGFCTISSAPASSSPSRFLSPASSSVSWLEDTVACLWEEEEEGSPNRFLAVRDPSRWGRESGSESGSGEAWSGGRRERWWLLELVWFLPVPPHFKKGREKLWSGWDLTGAGAVVIGKKWKEVASEGKRRRVVFETVSFERLGNEKP